MRLYKNILVLFVMVLFVATSYAQQLTHPMQVIITAPSSVAGSYAYGYQTDWGPTSLAGPVTGQLQWGYDITPDSIACDSIPNNGDLAGKIALVRRGACNFSLKALNAEKAGAIGCVICNNDGGTGVINMAGGTFGAQVTIPAVMLSDANCALLAARIAAGDSVSVTFQKPYISGAIVSFDYERPMSQIEVIDSMYVDITNAGATTATNTVTSFTITDPSGTPITTSLTTASLASGATASLAIPVAYTPTVMGQYMVVAKSDMAPNDSIVEYFQIGDYTYTLDEQGNHNQPFAWIGITDAAFATSNQRFDMGNVFRVINAGSATHASFSLDNTVSYFGEVFTISLYQCPNPVLGSEADYSTFTLLGIAVDTIDAMDTISNTVVITKPLLDVNTFADSVNLTAGERYMMVVKYDGANAGPVNSPRFNSSGSDVVIDLGVTAFTDRLYMGGFGEDSPHPVIRMHMTGYGTVPSAAVTILTPKTFDVFPNPVSDVLNVAVSLDEMAENMNVNLVDINGRILSTQQFSDTQQENIQFNTTELPAGFYFVRIQTENGVRVREFVKK